MLLVFLLSTICQDPGAHRKVVRPEGSVFAGCGDFELRTDIAPEEIIGLELFINGRSEHYFEDLPFEKTLDRRPRSVAACRALVIEEEVRLVRIPVLTDKICVMTDFAVLENGTPQEPALLFGEEKPLKLLVLLDLSGSMARRLFILRTGVNTWIDMLKQGDSIQLVGFNHRVFQICPEETDMDAVKKKLYYLRADGSTNLYGAVWSAVKMMGRADQRRAVLLFTDGDHDLDDEVDLYNKTKEDCISLAKENGVPIYTMGFGGPVPHKTINE